VLAAVEMADPDEGDEGGADDGPVLADEDAVTDVVGVGVTVGVAVAVTVGVGVGVVVRCTAGDEYVRDGWDGLVYGDVLVDEDGEADGVVAADETSGPTDTDAGGAAGDVCAAGDSIWTGDWLIECTTKAVAPLAPTMPPRISASTSGFTRRRDALGGGVAGGGVAGG
jgi:hypothetical protein